MKRKTIGNVPALRPGPTIATLVAFALALAVGLPGCGSKRTAAVTYHDPNMDFSLIRNVAVLPFKNVSSDLAAGEAVRDVFMTMLQATGAFYVVPPGEVARGVSRTSLNSPSEPSSEEVIRFAEIVGADVVIIGTVREYGLLRSGSLSAPVVSLGVRMLEGQTGTVVWSASASEGGVSAKDRMFGGGGQPMDDVTRKAVAKLLDRLFG